MEDLGLTLIGLAIATSIAVWIWNDADKLRGRGVKITPWVWALATWALLIVGLPLYLLLRTTVWSRQGMRNDALDLGDLTSLPEPDMTPDSRYAPWREA